jgi:hypothetical protein
MTFQDPVSVFLGRPRLRTRCVSPGRWAASHSSNVAEEKRTSLPRRMVVGNVFGARQSRCRNALGETAKR